VLHREKRVSVGHRGRGAGRDEPRRGVQSDEVVGGGLRRPADECDEPRGRGQNDRERDAR
jgi:hypothetical protein